MTADNGCKCPTPSIARRSWLSYRVRFGPLIGPMDRSERFANRRRRVNGPGNRAELHGYRGEESR